ncbi:MAG TPA: hypothetical protein VET66_13485 [Steroidobacteraceae bacterium]|nr:hypothetical protein [Steroidobacteraceae bacterium]
MKPTQKASCTDTPVNPSLTAITTFRRRPVAQAAYTIALAMPQSAHEQELRALARERIAKGELPGAPASRMWGGDGTGRLCSLCGEPVQPDQIEFEVESHGHSLIFHRVCQSVWQLECVNHGPRPPE